MSTPLLDAAHPLTKLLKTDRRYKFDAYVFVFEALNFAQDSLKLGNEAPVEAEDEPPPPRKKTATQKTTAAKDTPAKSTAKGRKSPQAERHLTGQQLCEGIRQYALDQYGLMAKTVLRSWGVQATRDFGNIVFNLIEIGQMRKTKRDKIEDFDNVFDFDDAFVRSARIEAIAK